MSEYDLVCDVCALAVEPRDAVVTWNTDGRGEHDFTLAHVACNVARGTCYAYCETNAQCAAGTSCNYANVCVVAR